MNKTIKALNKKLAAANTDASDIESKLQVAWNEVFNDCGAVKAMVAKVEDSQDYMIDEHGDICSYFYIDLSDFRDCLKYLETYLRDSYYIRVYGGCLTLNHGPDNLIIQNDSRHDSDNGVWCEHKLVIKESEYTSDDGEVDETKRNTLIEKYMEKTGFFPGVYRCDYHGNVFPVNTKEGN